MKFFGGVAFFGTVRAFCAPWFRIQYDDGDFEDVAKHELAPLIFFAEESFYDPRLWYYDFSVMNPMDVPAFRAALIAYVGGFGLDLPPSWSEIKGVENAERSRSSTKSGSEDDIEMFLTKEKMQLQALQLEHM